MKNSLKKTTARGYLARVLSAPDSSRLCSLFPATHLGVYVSRSALLWGGSNPGSDCWEQHSRRKDLWEASWVAGLGLRFSSSSRPSLACATLPMPGLMSLQSGTCQVTADLPGGHQTPIAVPGPTELPLFRYLRCLPCLALLSPWVPAHPHVGQATPASPRQPESIKMQKTNAFHFWVLIYYLWPSKYTERELIRAQSQKRKKNRGFHLASICTDYLENCLQYTLHYPKYLNKMRHLEEGLNLRDIPSSSKKTHWG